MRFYGFLSVFGTFSHKVAKTWFVLHETWHTTLFGIYYFVEVVKIEIIVICYKLRVKLRFYGDLSVFGPFARKVAQTWFFLHEMWYTILFCIYYCVKVVRIEIIVICSKLRV